MHLTEAHIDEIISFVRCQSGLGSILMFDYLFNPIVNDEQDGYRRMEHERFLRSLRKPACLSIDQGGVDAYLESRGFKVLEHYISNQVESSFYPEEKGGLQRKDPRYGGIVLAAQA